MREELNVNDLNQVVGGKVYINTRTRKIGFNNISGVYPLKDGASAYAALELCDSLIGKYATDAEYDQACFNALKAQGFI